MSAALLLPADGCGNCLTAHREVIAHPYRLVFDDDGAGLRAFYRCQACLWSWWTGWAIDALDLPCPGCPECSEGAA